MHVGIVTSRYHPNVQSGGKITMKMLAEQFLSAPQTDETTVLSFDRAENETWRRVKIRWLGMLSLTTTE